MVSVRFEHSAGGVVYRIGPNGPEIALASRRTKSGELAWGIPKGLVERGERTEETARREVREETGLDTVIKESLGDIRYFYVWNGQRISKKVTVYLMEAVGGDVSQHDQEMEEVRWFPARDAVDAASFRTERDLLQRGAAMLAGP